MPDVHPLGTKYQQKKKLLPTCDLVLVQVADLVVLVAPLADHDEQGTLSPVADKVDCPFVIVHKKCLCAGAHNFKMISGRKGKRWVGAGRGMPEICEQCFQT
jgi:hypothetical protein